MSRIFRHPQYADPRVPPVQGLQKVSDLGGKKLKDLHKINPNHPGILVVYRNANLLKNMTFKAIVKALANLESANVPLANQFIPLNQWNF